MDGSHTSVSQTSHPPFAGLATPYKSMSRALRVPLNLSQMGFLKWHIKIYLYLSPIYAGIGERKNSKEVWSIYVDLLIFAADFPEKREFSSKIKIGFSFSQST